MSLLEVLYVALGYKVFSLQLPMLLPRLLTLLASEKTRSHEPSLAVLRALASFHEALRDHLHVIGARKGHRSRHLHA